MKLNVLKHQFYCFHVTFVIVASFAKTINISCFSRRSIFDIIVHKMSLYRLYLAFVTL